MPLNYPAAWKFNTVGFGVPGAGVEEFVDLIVSIAPGEQDVVEIFKVAFGGAGNSSSYGWAISDLRGLATQKAENAAAFVDALWNGIESCARESQVPVPRHVDVNAILKKHGVDLLVEPPNLICPSRVEIADARGGADGADSAQRQYMRHEKLGAGGYGEVFRVTRTTAAGEFEYAMKVLDPSPFVENRERALQRFRREVAAIQKLQHRAIIQSFEAGLTSDGKPYVLMPMIKGADLRSAAAGVDLRELVGIFLEILYALAYAHDMDVLHRDLKPNNIIVRTSDRQPIILDFGAAYFLDELDEHNLTSQAVGTAGYIPSEVLADPGRRTPLHDVYSCGVMLYEVVAQRLPDPANYAPLGELDDSFGGLDEAVRGAIRGEGERTASALQFARELEELV